MTNPVAVIALTVDGTDVQAANFGIFLEIVKGLNESPSVRGQDTIIPGLAGRIARSRVADTLMLELRGIVTGDRDAEAGEDADFRTNCLAARALFAPTKSPVAVVATLEDGSTATINARPLPGAIWNYPMRCVAEVSFPMESVDPDWVVTPPEEP